MKITINIPERQIAFCYDLIKNGSYEEIGEAATSMASAIKENRTDIEVSLEVIKLIYTKAASLPYSYAKIINGEVKASLIPQLLPLATNEPPKQAEGEDIVARPVNDLLEALKAIDDSYKSQLDNNIQNVLDKLK